MRLGRAPVAAAVLLVAGCAGVTAPAEPAAGTQALRPEVLAETPHDPGAYTQGLQLVDGALYEGTGLAGRSQLRELDPETGAVRRVAAAPGAVFGEGIAVVGDRIWQLTWTDGVALEWDRATFTLLRQVPFTGEGWGLCFDGTRLVRSDGTDRLHFHDPVTFAETGSTAVALDGQPVTRLNELECVDGDVWSNVWQTDRIVRIDPDAGRVTAVVDAAGLLDPARLDDAAVRSRDAVLNGIAAHGDGEFLLTGKLWPAAFRVRFVPAG